MDSSQFEGVISGRMTNLPPMNSKIVRIFISSTFTDNAAERNLLMETVYPKLIDYCREKHGLEFQVVDMRWGVRDEVTDDHMTVDLCLEQIKTCQEVSIGPNFVTFIGQRHGWRPFPSVIPSAEFKLMLDCLHQLEKDTSVLEQWFREDINATPPVYLLQPISSRIPDYLSQDKAKRKTASNEWSCLFNQMQALLRLAAHTCYTQLTMDEEVKHKYFMSVTEKEILEGLANGPGNKDSRCVCFVRIIEDIGDNLQDDLAWQYIDMNDSKVDEEAQNLLTTFRDEKLEEMIHVTKNIIKWAKNTGISRQSHQDYLKKLSVDFFTKISTQIDNAVGAANDLSKDPVYNEVLQHLTLASARCGIFHGRQDVLDKVAEYFSKPSQQPLVLHGESGSGKTSIMAKVASEVSNWLGDKPGTVVITRFLGTSPLSSSLAQALYSINQQLAVNYDQKDVELDKDFNKILNQFQSFLNLATAEKPLAIILDSLDQLSSDNYTYDCNWLPQQLPPNVHFVVSTLPKEHGILEAIKLLIDETNFIQIPTLGEELSFDILTSWLKNRDRTLSNFQVELVKKAFDTMSLPLYVSLVFQEVVQWKSYTNVNESSLVYTIHKSIDRLFEDLEFKYGLVFIQHSLAYLTASQSGLSEAELDDLLSLDDAVLSDVYQYHVPPIRRIPPLLWIRVRHDISSYVVDREADGLRVTYWFHRQFREVATQRYLSDPEFTKNIHSAMSDYYLGKWHNVEKPFIASEYEMRKLKLSTNQGKADRRVPAQPLVFSQSDNTKTAKYNVRKLKQLPYHIGHSQDWDLLKTTCLFNYEWLLTKLKATSIQQILIDFDFLPEDLAVTRLKGALNSTRPSLNATPSTLAIEVIGRLLPFTIQPGMELLKDLVSQCYKQGHKECRLLPRHHCYPSPGGALVYSLQNENLDLIPDMLKVSPDSKTLFSATKTNELIVWDLTNGEIRKKIKLTKDSDIHLNVFNTSKDGRFMVFATAYQKDTNPVFMVEIATASATRTTMLEKVYTKIGFPGSLSYEVVENYIIATNAQTQEVDIFDISTGKLITSLDVKASMTAVTLKYVVCAVKKKDMIKIFSLVSFEEIAEVSNINLPLQVTTSQDGRTAFVLEPLVIKFLNLNPNNGKVGDVIQVVDISALSSSKVSRFLVSLSDNFLAIIAKDCVTVYDIMRNSMMPSFTIPAELNPDGKRFDILAKISNDDSALIVTYEKHVILWNLKSKAMKMKQMFKKNTLNLLATPDFKNFITTFRRSNIMNVYSIENLDEITHKPLSMDDSSRYIASASEADVTILRSANSKETRVLNNMTVSFQQSVSKEYESMKPLVTPDGRFTLLRDYNSEEALRIWDCKTGEHVSTLPLSSTKFRGFAISKNSKLVVTHSESSCDKDVEVAVWNIKKTSPLLQTSRSVLEAQEGGFSTYFVFAGEDKYVAAVRPHQDQGDAADKNGELVVYELKTEQRVACLDGIMSIQPQALANNSYHILCHAADMDGKSKLVVFSVSEQTKIREIDVETTISSLSIDRYAKYALDYDTKLIDLETGKCLFQAFNDSSRYSNYTAPKLSKDGRYIVWLDALAAQVMVNSTETFEVIGSVYVHSTPMGLEISSKNIIFITCDDGRVMLLQVVDDDVLKSTDLHKLAVQSYMPKKGGKTPAPSGDKKVKSSRTCEIL